DAVLIANVRGDVRQVFGELSGESWEVGATACQFREGSELIVGLQERKVGERAHVSVSFQIKPKRLTGTHEENRDVLRSLQLLQYLVVVQFAESINRSEERRVGNECVVH